MNETEQKVAERFKFWEEQDEINKELIPRVIKNHELISDTMIQLDLFSNNLAKVNEDMNLLKEQNKNFEDSIIDIKKNISLGNFAEIYGDVDKITAKVNKRKSRQKYSNMSLLLSIIALIIALSSAFL